jgi:hypothetical protein
MRKQLNNEGDRGTTLIAGCDLRVTFLRACVAVFVSSILFCGSLARADIAATQAAAPVVFQSPANALVDAWHGWVTGDPNYKQVLADLNASAEADLKDGPYTIVDKRHLLANVDPHDYVSLAPYFWPDPNVPDGLPFVRRDGERNPEIYNYDLKPLDSMSGHVYRLALAGYVTGERKYSDRAAELIRVWFFDAATRMNPNLEHAQLVEGVNDGRGTGIIESNRMMNVVDAVGLLNASGETSWTKDDDAKIRQWFSDYRKWMQTSEHGKSEAAAANNHGSWYAVQLTTYSLFLGDEVTARKTAESAKERIAKQITPDGQEPLELVRTKSYGYSTFNVLALTQLATLGERVGVDLWNYKSDDGRSLRGAIDFLIPFATKEKKWEHQQIEPLSGMAMFVPLRRAAAAYREPEYDEIATELRGGGDDYRFPATFQSGTTARRFIVLQKAAN